MSGFENDVMYAKNSDYTAADNQNVLESNGLATNGQMWIGTTALNTGGTHINVGRLTSPGGTVTIGYSSPNITLEAAAGGVTSITGGPGVTITGTAAVPIVNSVLFTDTTATTLEVDKGYNATAAGTYNMPATAVQGELITVNAELAGVILDAPALNFIRVGSQITIASGTITSTAAGDSITLRYRLSSLTWIATSVVGNWTVQIS